MPARPRRAATDGHDGARRRTGGLVRWGPWQHSRDRAGGRRARAFISLPGGGGAPVPSAVAAGVVASLCLLPPIIILYPDRPRADRAPPTHHARRGRGAGRGHQLLLLPWLLHLPAAGSPSTRRPRERTRTPPSLPLIPSPTLLPPAGCLRAPSRSRVPAAGGHEAAEGPAGAAPDGQHRHGRHHARLPLRPHLHQGAILLQPIPQAGGGAGGGGGGRGLRQHQVQAQRPHRGGGLRSHPPHVLQHQQALRALRRRGGHPRRRQPLQDLHQPAGARVADQAVRAPPRRRRHGRRPRVHARPLRRRQRHRRPAALHRQPLRPGIPLLQRRLRGQPLPRLHRRARAALHQHQPLRRRGPVPAQRDEGLVERQVHAAVPPALKVRGDRRRQRPRGALLPADRHRRHLPPRHGHRPVALPGGRHRRRLQAPPPPRVPAGARRGVAFRRAAEGPPAPAHHLPQELAPVPQRARHGARGGAGALRRAHRRARQPHGHAQLRAAGELGGRDDGGARRGARQHGVPAQPRRAHPGGALRGPGVAHQGDLQGPGQGHGRQLHGVQRVAGGELAEGPLPGGPFLPQAPVRRAQEGMGRHQDGLPRQAERQAQPHQIHQDAGAGTRSPAHALMPSLPSDWGFGVGSCNCNW